MITRKASEIKKLQREALIFKEISPLLQQFFREQQNFEGLFLSKVELTPDSGLCRVLLSTNTDRAYFDQRYPILKCHAPSLRKALATILDKRRTPEVLFCYDDSLDRFREINNAFERANAKEKLTSVNQEETSSLNKD